MAIGYRVPAHAVTAPAVSTPVSETGRLGVDVYNISGTFVAWVPDIIRATVTRRVNQIGSFEFTCSAFGAQVSALTVGRQVRIFREGEGEIFRGIIDDLRQEAGDGPTLTVSGSSMAEELVWLNTYLGIPVEGETIQDAVASLMVDATSWQAAVGGTGFAVSTLTDPFINQSVFRALTRVGEVVDGYIRETGRPREIQVMAETNPSGIRLSNIEYADPGLLDNDLIGLIQSIKVRQEGSALINRLVPFAESVGDVEIDLSRSTRSSPYTIQSFLTRQPRITNVATSTYSTAVARGSVTILVTGVSRLLVVGVLRSSAVGTRLRAVVNGQDMTLSEEISPAAGDFPTLSLFYLTNPPVGPVTVDWEISGDTSPLAIIAVALDYVDQINPIRADANASATSTTPSITVTSNADDLAIDFLYVSDQTVTQTPANNSLANADVGGSFGFGASSKDGASPNVSLGWTLSGSSHWAQVALSIKPRYVYYLEDSTSVTAYGRRVSPLTLKANRAVAGEDADLVALSNTLYDIAASRLQKLKDPVSFYDVEVVKLSPAGWLVGDSMRLRYRGIGTRLNAAGTAVAAVWLDVDTDIPVLERTEIFDEDGVRRWKLQMAAVYRFPRTVEEILSGQLAQVNDLESL